MSDAADRADARIRAAIEEGEAQARRACAGEPGDGVCEDCGDEIPPARLEVWPHARRCVECQQDAERGGL